jgi:hypothetical protein
MQVPEPFDRSGVSLACVYVEFRVQQGREIPDLAAFSISESRHAQKHLTSSKHLRLALCIISGTALTLIAEVGSPKRQWLEQKKLVLNPL